MALSEAYTGTPTIGTTEYSLPNASTVLTPIATPGIYQLVLDLFNMAASEVFQLKIYERARLGGISRLIQSVEFYGVQTEPIYVYPALHLRHGWDFTLTKIQGTDRAIPFSIRLVS